MKQYENMMEGIVEEEMESLGDSLGCCMCEQCRSDISSDLQQSQSESLRYSF